MTEREMLVIDVTPEERQRIEARARQHGYPTAREYLLALVEADEEIDDLDLDTREGLLSGVRASLRQAIKGETRPVSELWDAVAEDE